MRKAARSVFLFLLGLLGAVFLGAAMAFTAAVALAATTALIVPGTGTPVADRAYMENVRDYYLGGTPCNSASCTLTSIEYPASFWPLPFPGWCRSGPDGCDTWNVSVAKGVEDLDTKLGNALAIPNEQVVVFGYSQGGQVVSNEMHTFANLTPEERSRISVVVIGSIANPDGGLWPRLSPISFVGQLLLDATFGPPMITDTGVPTTVIGFEYDPVVYAPKYWGNPLALLNALAAFQTVHGQYLAGPNRPGSGTLPYGYTEAELLAALTDPDNIRDGGNPNNTYIMIPAKSLPLADLILSVADSIGIGPIVKPFVDLLAPIAKVIIDLAYDWSGDPDVPQSLSLLPFNPAQDWGAVGVDLVEAAAQGIQAFLQDLGVSAARVTQPATRESASTLALALTENATAATEEQTLEPEESMPAAKLRLVRKFKESAAVPEATEGEVVEQDPTVIEEMPVTQVNDPSVTEPVPALETEDTNAPKDAKGPRVRKPGLATAPEQAGTVDNQTVKDETKRTIGTKQHETKTTVETKRQQNKKADKADADNAKAAA